MAASGRSPFSFDQADSTQLAASAVAATGATIVITLTLKAGRNWLVVAGCLSFQEWMRGENLHFFIQM